MDDQKKTSLEKHFPTMEKMFERMEADIEEKGYDWSVYKTTKSTVIKQTYKKDYGYEVSCFQAIGTLPFNPKFILENAVLNTDSIKVKF
jgi:hypothetical protein